MNINANAIAWKMTEAVIPGKNSCEACIKWVILQEKDICIDEKNN